MGTAAAIKTPNNITIECSNNITIQKDMIEVVDHRGPRTFTPLYLSEGVFLKVLGIFSDALGLGLRCPVIQDLDVDKYFVVD